MEDSKCPIWGTPAEDYPRSFDGRDIFSARAGGRYQITGNALTYIENNHLDEASKAKLSLLISDSQDLDQPFLVADKTLKEVPNWLILRPFEKAKRLLHLIAKCTPALGVAGIRWNGKFGTLERDRALATCGLLAPSELMEMLQFLNRKGYCETYFNRASATSVEAVLTLEGAEEVAAPAPTSQSDEVFVAMWFSEETQSAFDNGIRPALAELGFRANRIDQKEHNNKIDDEIIAEIRQSRFLVADFTCGTTEANGQGTAIARGGVYFEAGFAMGLGIPVIWCCREDLINQVHFDTRQYNHITWNTPEELREKLKNRVGAVIGSYSGKQLS